MADEEDDDLVDETAVDDADGAVVVLDLPLTDASTPAHFFARWAESLMGRARPGTLRSTSS